MHEPPLRIKTCEKDGGSENPSPAVEPISYSGRINTGNINLLAVIFVADATPASGEFSWAWAVFWAVMALLVAFVGLGYRAGWFLPKYRLTKADPMDDNLTVKIFGPPEIAARSRRQAQVVPRYQLSRSRSDGFKVVRVAFGREFFIGSQCVYAAERDDGTWEDQVLVARGNCSSKPMPLHEQVNEIGRSLTEMVHTFGVNAKDVQASRGYYRERLRLLKQRYDGCYQAYRQRHDAGESAHTLTAQLVDAEARIKDLDRRLDNMR